MHKRKLSYDIIRIVALMMIVMVHVSAYMVIYFPDTAQIEWTIGNIFNGVARAGVPMFIMLSGALLLNEEKAMSPKVFYRKNLLRMALLAVGWIVFYGLVYAFALPAAEGKAISGRAFWDFLLSFKGSDYPHLWYMLMVIGMYLMIPVLRLFVKRENKAYIIGIIFGCGVVQFAAATANIFTINAGMTVSAFLTKFHLEPLTGFLAYLLIGWYFNNYEMKASARRLLYAAGLVSVVTGTIIVYSSIDAIPQIRDYMYSELSLPAMLYGCALFALIQSLCRGKTTGSRALCTASDSSFGVYLVHVLLMEIFVRLILPYERFGLGKPLAYILILYGFTLVASYLVVRLAAHTRILRKAFFNR